MGISEVDIGQKDSYCNCCSGRDAILIYFGSGDLLVPRQPTAAAIHQSESLYTKNPLNTFFQNKPVSLKCLSNLDLKMSIVLELTTDAGSLFQWLTILTLKYDLRAIVLYLCTFNFIPLPLVADTLFISKIILD